MTEDDTFRVLKQMPFERVSQIVRRRIINMETPEEAEELLRQFGWTFDEFYRRAVPE